MSVRSYQPNQTDVVLPPTFTARVEWGVRYRGQVFYISVERDDAVRVVEERPDELTLLRRVVIEGPWE